MEVRFCYRFAEEAEDIADIYMQYRLTCEKTPNEQQYSAIQNRLRQSFAKEHDLDPEWIIPITPEEYDSEIEDDDKN